MSNEIRKQDEKRVSVKSLLDSPAIKRRFEEMLGKNSAGFVSSIISATQLNADLGQCDPGTVVGAAAVAATLNLPINASLAFAHIVPYKGRAQFQLGWRGYVQLALRTGLYSTINVTDVFDGELVSINRFTGEYRFKESDSHSGKIVGYYAYFKMLNGFEKGVYMSRTDCEAHGRRYSAGYGKSWSKWTTDFDAMARKTVLKQLLQRWGSMSIETHYMETGITADQAQVTIEPGGEFSFAYIDAQGEQSLIEHDRPAAPYANTQAERLADAMADAMAEAMAEARRDSKPQQDPVKQPEAASKAPPTGTENPASKPIQQAPAKPASVVVPTLQDVTQAMNQRRLNQIEDEVRAALDAAVITNEQAIALNDAIAAKQNDLLMKGTK